MEFAALTSRGAPTVHPDLHLLEAAMPSAAAFGLGLRAGETATSPAPAEAPAPMVEGRPCRRLRELVAAQIGEMPLDSHGRERALADADRGLSGVLARLHGLPRDERGLVRRVDIVRCFNAGGLPLSCGLLYQVPTTPSAAGCINMVRALSASGVTEPVKISPANGSYRYRLHFE